MKSVPYVCEGPKDRCERKPESVWSITALND
jgi:hypothetical protein